MNRKSFSKRLAALLLMLCIVLSAVPVQAAKTVKADKALTIYVNKAVKNSRVTKSNSKKAALKKVFNYTAKFQYGRATMGFKPEKTKNWERDFAKAMLKTKRGSCYHSAAAFAYLAKKVTGYQVRIGYGQAKAFSQKYQAHAWVEIKIGKTWYTYDPNAAAMKSSVLKGKWYQQKRTAMRRVYNFNTAKYTYVRF